VIYIQAVNSLIQGQMALRQTVRRWDIVPHSLAHPRVNRRNMPELTLSKNTQGRDYTTGYETLKFDFLIHSCHEHFGTLPGIGWSPSAG